MQRGNNMLKLDRGCPAGLPSIISDAAHSVSSNMSSNLGDLLGLSEEKPQPTPADALPHQRSSSAAQQGTPRAEGDAGFGHLILAARIALYTCLRCPGLSD